VRKYHLGERKKQIVKRKRERDGENVREKITKDLLKIEY